jgi:leader peptidase (prepilin peptidase)/N-methyltransferase
LIENVPRPLVIVWVLLAGAAIGSFLNVVIARVPAGQSVIHPPSRCPRCGASIAWYDNIPLFSYLLLRARCRACHAPISWRYPLVEALGAAAALVAFERHGFTAAAAAEFAFAAALLALAFIDLDTWLLPNTITRPLLASGVLLGAVGMTPAGSILPACYGAGLGYGAFALFAWIGEKAFKKEALGEGDVWLLAGLGAWLGPSALLPVVLFASLQGSIVGLTLIALGKGQPGPEQTAVRSDPLQALHGETDEAPGAPGAAPPAPSTLIADADADADADWVPPKHAVPFGPFLVAGALEWLWLGGLLSRAVPLLRLFR